MEPTSRSGHDRRQNNVITENDRRSAQDWRIIINRIEHYTGILEKIPVFILGEMGIFTGNPRSATVMADDDSLIITINKKELMRLFKVDHDLCRVLLMNVIGELSNKLRHLNELFDRLMQLHVVE